MKFKILTGLLTFITAAVLSSSGAFGLVTAGGKAPLISKPVPSPMYIKGIITINEGAPTTSDKNGFVMLKIFARGATEMLISNDPSFIGARWEPLNNRKKWRLRTRDGDGLKTVYAKFRNGDDVSEVEQAQIILDTEPPTGGMLVINGGIDFTNSRDRKVNLELFANDAYQMRISNRDDFLKCRWIPFRDNWEYLLTGSDGPKVLFAQFRDQAGNLTDVVADTIIMDRMPPQNVRVKINNDARFTTDTKVKLALMGTGAAQVKVTCISRTRAGEVTKSEGEWLPYTKVMDYELSPGTAEKTLYVIFQDAVGNMSRPAIDKIILDQTPPASPRVLVENGNRYTKTVTVNLRLSAPGASHFMVSNDDKFKGRSWLTIPQNYLLPTWQLTEGEGTKNVYVKYRDLAGNESTVATDDITLDFTPPTNPKIEIITKEGIDGFTRDSTGEVSLKMRCEDARYMMISNSSSFYEAHWEIYQESKDLWQLGGGGDAEKSVYIKFRDKAGNVSKIAMDRVELDRQAPVAARITINEGKSYTNSKTVKLDLMARSVYEMKIYNNGDTTGAKWIPYKRFYKGWELDSEDDTVKVCVMYRDRAHNVAGSRGTEGDPYICDDIILDTKPPYDCIFMLNKGDSITNDPNKNVLVTAKAKGAFMMRVSPFKSFEGAPWQRYSDLNLPYILPGDDGYKTLYAQFRDQAGNLSEVLKAEIKLDRQPPYRGEVVINDGDNGTNRQEVTLTLKALEAKEMIISNRLNFLEAEWEPFTSEKKWVLIDEEGLKTVFVKFKDIAGNISEVCGARIGYDKTAPKNGTFSINKNAKYCTEADRRVTIYATVKEATKIKISNNPEFDSADFERYNLVHEWYLSPEDGEKTVWVKFADNYGNETEPISQTIILDRQEPYNAEVSINGYMPVTNKRKVKLEISVDEAHEMIISNMKSFGPPSKWQPVKSGVDWVLPGADGIKNVWIKFRDKARNESFVASAMIKLDTKPPHPGVISINGGARIVAEPSVELTLNAQQAQFMMVSNSRNFDGGSENWVEYKDKYQHVLSAGAGYKEVWVKFKDDSGNVSAPIRGNVTLEAP